jgi:hypothetical protein
VLKNAGRVTEVAVLRGEVKQSIRNHIASLVFGLAPVRHAMADAMTELSIGYPDSLLNGPSSHTHGGPKAGERAPVRADERPVGAGDTPKFAVFAEDADAALVARYGSLLEAEVRKPFHDGGLWLVRPDGYVALATGRDGWDDVAAYLARIVS